MRGDAVDALKKCAKALQHGNLTLANTEMGRVLTLAEKEIHTPTGRLIRYFAQALACRAYGFHPKYLSFPSPDWKYWMYDYYALFESVGQYISDVVKGKRKVHVIELVKHMDGYKQWASLLKMLFCFGDRDLMHLRFSFLVQENVEFSKETEENLTKIAADHGIKLEYKTFRVNSFAGIDMSLLEMRDGEFVVVNCMFLFSKMLSEASALKKLLEWVRDVIRPNIMIVVEHDANHNQPDFLLRFDESLEYYSSLFEVVNFYDGYNVSEPYFRYQICNIVACEGSNRVERHQTWAQWKSLLMRYGFSIFNLFTNRGNREWEEWIEDGILWIKSDRKEKRPVFFVSAWETLTCPSKSSGSNEGLCIISSESDPLQTLQISPECLFTMTGPNLADDLDCGFFDQIDLLDFLNEDVDAGLSVADSATFPSIWTAQSESLPGFHSVFSNNGNSDLSAEFSVPDLDLIRMASLAEIHDILQNICGQYEVGIILTWANRVHPAHLHHEMGSSLLLKPILCVEDFADVANPYILDELELSRWKYEEGEGIVGKALKYNQPFYVPVIESGEKVCPYLLDYCRKDVLGALAIKLSSAYASCGDYVVELLFRSYDRTLETQKRLVRHILEDLKNATPRFVTYGNQDPLVELAEHDPAVSDTMLARRNPYFLKVNHKIVGNSMDGQLPMQQLHYTGVLDVMPTQGNLPAQSTNAFSFEGKSLAVNPRDGNVLQWPHEQGPPIQPHVSATSNIEASRENIGGPPIGDFNLNGRISSSGNNQIVEYNVTDMQVPHKQGNKRQRILRSDVWNHYEKVAVVDGESLAKCKYCDFKTDGSSKKGTSHLRKHFENRHRKIKNVHQSSNLPSKNLEPQSTFKEKCVLDEDKIHLDMARVIIKYKLPLSIIHDEHLKNLFKMLQPKFEFQSEQDLEPHILRVYNEEKRKLYRYFDKLSCCFNLVINLWKDDAKGMVNCCLTVQFIDDSWELKKKVLTFERLEHDFDAASLCGIFERVLLDWNIKEKTCSLTVHSSLSNVEIVHDEKIWPSDIFYLSYDKCIKDINCMIADISLKSIYQVYEEMNQHDNIVHTLMNVECSNNWRICSLILVIVAVLHPSLKLDFVEFVYKKIYEDAIAKEQLDKISNFLVSLYDKYASSCSNHTKFTTAIGDTCSSSPANADDKVWDSFRKYKVSKQSRLELYQYLKEDEGSSMEINILNWWCNNCSRFPTLGMMARDFLAIPLSTIMSSSAFAKEFTKFILNSGDQESHIINAMICCQDWLESTKPSTCNERCDEKLTREWRAWSRKYLLWDFTHEDLELLGKWKNPKITGQHVGLDEKFKIQDKFLAPLVIPLVDAIIQGTPQLYYIGDEVVNKYFLLLMERSKENPSMFLQNTNLDSSTASLLLGGDQPPVPTWINPVEQISTCQLFLPLCFLDHWILFYADIKYQKFVWLDSRKHSAMQMPSNYERIPEWFKGSLLPAMGLNNARDWPVLVPGDIPKQENGIDCGIFVMKYADCLTHANCIGFPFSQDDMPHFRERIFLDIYNGGIHVPEKFYPA